MKLNQPRVRRALWSWCSGGAGVLSFGLSLLSAPAGVLSAKADPANVFGVAHSDGKYYLTTQNFLDEGADQILATGSKVIKLQLTPKRYPWNSNWPKGSDSLAQLAQTPYFKSVFSKPFNTYILTAYSLGQPEHYWTAGITAEQAADETQIGR